MEFKMMKQWCLMMKFGWCVTIALSLVLFVAYITLSLRLLLDPSPIMIAACRLAPEREFFLDTLLLLMVWSVMSALAWRWSQRTSVQSSQRSRRVTAFKFTALVIFPMLPLWFSLLLTIIIGFELPPLELWSVAIALTWMTTPFATLGFMYVGAKLGSWLNRMK
jgi:hypothetical protein